MLCKRDGFPYCRDEMFALGENGWKRSLGAERYAGKVEAGKVKL